MEKLRVRLREVMLSKRWGRVSLLKEMRVSRLWKLKVLAE